MGNLFQIRVTGILIERGKILIVKQRVTAGRAWSLPGGRLENGETLEEGVLREVFEETGLHASVLKLLYLCDMTDASPPILHITFLLERESGKITLPTNEYDSNPILDVRMVYIKELTKHGFSEKFTDIVLNDFPDAGSYVGHKENIGL